MRELNASELSYVSGGVQQECTEGNSYGGISDASSLGQDLIAIYEGLIEATSYMFSRIAAAW